MWHQISKAKLGGEQMKRVAAQIIRTVGVVEALALAALLTGCAGLSQQFGATTSGMKIEYKVPRETFSIPNEAVRVLVRDERLDTEFLGAGAKSTMGSRVLGFFAFGIISLAVPGEPSFQQSDLVGIFQKAFEERLRANGISIARGSETNGIALEVLLRNFRLDFNFGKWVGEAGYVMSMRKNSVLLCEDRVSEKVTKFNTFGYGTGEAALSEVFTKAVNRANLSECLSRIGTR